ncbi:uncharacterized protein BDV14DRAFT_197873 [Aspergillus stella-maris]|uniref:uncharacterized protein n=1 Tax=Aspergillus stella-maris TaxID=1810926 RepID=UPI003CCCFBC3
MEFVPGINHRLMRNSSSSPCQVPTGEKISNDTSGDQMVRKTETIASAEAYFREQEIIGLAFGYTDGTRGGIGYSGAEPEASRSAPVPSATETPWATIGGRKIVWGTDAAPIPAEVEIWREGYEVELVV